MKFDLKDIDLNKYPELTDFKDGLITELGRLLKISDRLETALIDIQKMRESSKQEWLDNKAFLKSEGYLDVSETIASFGYSDSKGVDKYIKDNDVKRTLGHYWIKADQIIK